MFGLLDACNCTLFKEEPQMDPPKSLLRNVPRRLLPHLFMGDPRAAADVETLRALKIKNIVNVSPQLMPGRCVTEASRKHCRSLANVLRKSQLHITNQNYD